jgi:quercetin dioxygenase-like cupin family protein
MQRVLAAGIAALLGLGAVAFAQKSKDAVIVDPAAHQVVLENEHVRVIEAVVSPGAKSPMHSHPPGVFVSLETGRARMGLPDGKSAILNLKPAQVMWVDGSEHSWEMIGGQVHVFLVEVKSAAQGRVPTPVTPGPLDPVTVDPTHHHVLFENDHVRVFEGLASHGARSPRHSHQPFVLISLGKSRMRLTNADGTSGILDLNRGQVIWLPQAEHSWELLAGQAHVVAVEVKSARRATS